MTDPPVRAPDWKEEVAVGGVIRDDDDTTKAAAAAATVAAESDLNIWHSSLAQIFQRKTTKKKAKLLLQPWSEN